jgi:hypothetical protein
MNDSGMSKTVVGVPIVLDNTEPIPTCPKLLCPQHCTDLLVSTAHVVEPPAAIFVAEFAKVTCTGFS